MSYLCFYLIVAFIVMLFLDVAIQLNIGCHDKEFDDLVSDKKLRLFSVFVLGMIWIVSMPIILYNNIVNK